MSKEILALEYSRDKNVKFPFHLIFHKLIQEICHLQRSHREQKSFPFSAQHPQKVHLVR
jgi:hypothetical protein